MESLLRRSCKQKKLWNRSATSFARRSLHSFGSQIRVEATNNIAEYEACILALEAAIELGIKELEVFGDSALFICQIKGEWKTSDEKLLPYHAYLEALTKEFVEIEFNYLSRNKNQFADALATLASMVEIPEGGNVKLLVIECKEKPVYCCSIREGEIIDNHPWFYDIKRLIEEREYPEEASRVDRRTLRRLASHYVVCGGNCIVGLTTGFTCCVSRKKKLKDSSKKFMKE